ncbi:MAG: FKBP-type peptidyl-prolyl cis-trans isomerase [Bacteroides sp.]|nr:FKBP-type peptidyl-prolyl cis-trans isomerase [Bacteroides sp.]
MKKNFIPAGLAAAVVLVAGLASCGGNKAEKQQEDTAAIEEMVAAVQQATTDGSLRAYDAAFFNNPDRRSTGASTDSTYFQTASGLKYTVVKEGSGARPSASDNVTVHYTGRLTDGRVFDSSVDRGEPTSFPLNRVIPGWTEGLQLMQEGGVAVFYIPSELGYGEMGTPGGPIPPNAPLIFEVQLIKVN